MNSTRPQTQRHSDAAPAGRGQPADRRPGAVPDLALVRARLARELLTGKAPHAEPRRAADNTLYAV